MEQNNDTAEQRKNIDYAKLVEKIYLNQANERCSLNAESTSTGPSIQNDKPLLQHQSQSENPSTHIVSYQEYASTSQSLDGLSSQINNSQPHQSIIQTQFRYATTTSPENTKTKPQESNELILEPLVIIQENEIANFSQTRLPDTINTSKSDVAMSTENSDVHTKPIEFTKSLSSGLRAAEFVLKNLDSVPGEEKFYNWSNKTKDFANNQKKQEKLYSNVANLIDSHSDQLFMVNNETIWSRYKAPKGESLQMIGKFQDSDGKTPSKKKKVSVGKEKVVKNANWALERDYIVKKYSQRLMRKKPSSWLPQLSADDPFSNI